MLRSHLVWYLIPFDVIVGGVTGESPHQKSKWGASATGMKLSGKIKLAELFVLPSVSFPKSPPQTALQAHRGNNKHATRKHDVTRRWMVVGLQVFPISPVGDCSHWLACKGGSGDDRDAGYHLSGRAKITRSGPRRPHLIISVRYYANKPCWNTGICPWLRPPQH